MKDEKKGKQKEGKEKKIQKKVGLKGGKNGTERQKCRQDRGEDGTVKKKRMNGDTEGMGKDKKTWLEKKDEERCRCREGGGTSQKDRKQKRKG